MKFCGDLCLCHSVRINNLDLRLFGCNVGNWDSVQLMIINNVGALGN